MSEPGEERRFLHEVANPLTAALFTLDVALESARAAGDASMLQDLERIQKSLEKVRLLLRKRRELLIQRSGEP